MLRTVFFFAYIGFTVIFLVPIGLVIIILSLLGLRKPMSFFMYYIAKGWAYSIIGMVGCKMTVAGQENIPRKGGVCFVSNHGSIFDIVLLLAYAGRPFGFISKKELLYLPLLNMFILILGGLFIDRKNYRKALVTINKGIQRLKKGEGMVIFPEGRRSRGEGLLPFHPGSLRLATKSGAIIVPVALKGTYEIYEKNHRAMSGPVMVTFCKPIDTSDIGAEDRKQALADNIHATIKKALAAE